MALPDLVKQTKNHTKVDLKNSSEVNTRNDLKQMTEAAKTDMQLLSQTQQAQLNKDLQVKETSSLKAIAAKRDKIIVDLEDKHIQILRLLGGSHKHLVEDINNEAEQAITDIDAHHHSLFTSSTNKGQPVTPQKHRGFLSTLKNITTTPTQQNSQSTNLYAKPTNPYLNTSQQTGGHWGGIDKFHK